MTDREELIEEAYAVLRMRPGLSEKVQRVVLDLISALQDVGKAHTPSDDEREALRIAALDARQAAYRKEREDWYVDHEAEPEIASNAFFRGWDAAVDGGFRRSEVPEPSADPAPRGWRSAPTETEPDRILPQGEPSDAQVGAAMKEASRRSLMWRTSSDVKAVLRAARGVR